MALTAADIGGRVFAAQRALDIFSREVDNTQITATDGGEDGDLLASLLVDLHHWANAQGLDWDFVTTEAADEYREQTGGPVYR